MMLAASAAIQASSPTERPFPRSTKDRESGLFLLPKNAFHRETHFLAHSAYGSVCNANAFPQSR